MSKMLIINDNQDPPHLPNTMDINFSTNDKQVSGIENQSENGINVI